MLITFYTEVTMPDGGRWVCTAIRSKKTVEATVKWLNATSKLKGLGSTYRAATREEYLAYRAEVKAVIEGGTNAVPARPDPRLLGVLK